MHTALPCSCTHQQNHPRHGLSTRSLAYSATHAVQACSGNGCPLRGVLDVTLADAHRSEWARRWRLQPRLARLAVCMMRGSSDREAADALGLSMATVRTYVRGVYEATGTNNRAKLLLLALGVDLDSEA